MRTVAFVTCLLMLAPTVAAGQEATPIAEVSGGYSVLPQDSWNGHQWWSGWLISSSVNVTRWFGVAAEVGSNYFTERYSFDAFDGADYYEFSTDRLFAGIGPRFVARGRRVSGFGHFLVGVENRFTLNLFSVQAGGGVDVWLTPSVGIRGGIDGRGSWYEEEKDGSWRLHTGVVFALGSR
jgi:hypothetical protein